MCYGEVTSGADTPKCGGLQGGRPSCAVGFQSLQRGSPTRGGLPHHSPRTAAAGCTGAVLLRAWGCMGG